MSLLGCTKFCPRQIIFIFFFFFVSPSTQLTTCHSCLSLCLLPWRCMYTVSMVTDFRYPWQHRLPILLANLREKWCYLILIFASTLMWYAGAVASAPMIILMKKYFLIFFMKYFYTLDRFKPGCYSYEWVRSPIVIAVCMLRYWK